MTRILQPLTCLAAMALACAAAGCGKSPTAPAPPSAVAPPPSILTPREAVVTRIVVTKFPSKKTNGDDWDASLIVSSRRPDLYLVLGPTGGLADFVSGTVVNAEFGTAHAFTSSSPGGVMARIPYGTSRRSYVMDEDFGGDDDTVGWITVNLPTAYRNDNARDLDYTFTDSGNRLSVRVVGTWSY